MGILEQAERAGDRRIPQPEAGLTATEADLTTWGRKNVIVHDIGCSQQ